MRTLLLDCNYFPVKIIHWQKAIVLLIAERAEVIEEYQDIKIRSISKSITLPKILKLYKTHKLSFNVKFTRTNVFLRDAFSCQYCGIKQNEKELTFDHVIPVSREGKTTWDNVVTCCKKCNSKKGPHLLHQTNMKLIKPPKKPHWSPDFCFRLEEHDPQEWYDFLRIEKSA